MQQAKTLNDIIELKQSHQLTDETVNIFYSQPPGMMIERIHRFFRIMHPHPQKMLIIGPVGAGKKSLLQYLIQSKFQNYHCLTVPLQNRLNPLDISQVDIIFCLLHILIDNLSKTQKRLDPGLLNNLYQNLHDDHLISLIHFKKSEAGDAEGTKLGFIQSFIHAIVEAISTTGREIRNHIRKSFEPRLRLILKNVQAFVDYSNHILKPEGRSLLIIFNDLGQFDQSAEIFFQNHLSITERINTHIIYTMPDFVRFSPFFQTICDRMDRIEYLRTSPVINHDQTPFEPGKQFIDHIISKRIDPRLIPEMMKEMIIMTSGGVLNDALYLTIETAICSLIDNTECEQLQQKAFESIKSQFIRNKLQQLSYQEFCLLKGLDLSKPSWTGNQDIQSLMRKNILIEYETDQCIWFDIHPLIKEYTGIKPMFEKE